MNEEDLLHAKELEDFLATQGQRRWAREFRRLLVLAEAVVTASPQDRQDTINDLEEYLR